MSGRAFVLCGASAIGLVIASEVFAERLNFLGRWPCVVVALAIGVLMFMGLIIVPMIAEEMRDRNAR